MRARPHRWPALALAAALCCIGAPAAADEAAAFRAATEAMAAGEHGQAARELEALADRSPEDPWADDALMKAAELYEQRLGEPTRALELYRRLLRDHPDSRLTRRARARSAALVEGMGPDGSHAAALAAYRDVLSRWQERGPEASIRAMEALLDQHPSFPRAAEARLWLANSYRSRDQLDDALAWYRRARQSAPDTALAWQARKGEGDLLLARGDFDGAAAIYESLRGSGDRTRDLVAARALAEVEIQRARAHLRLLARLLLALAGLALVGLLRRESGSWRAAARAVARPPLELVFLLPVAAVLAAAAYASGPLIARPVGIIAAGSSLITWLSGAVLEATRRRRGRIGLPRAIAHAVAAALAVAALCYLAVSHEQLLDLLAHTRRFGHE